MKSVKEREIGYGEVIPVFSYSQHCAKIRLRTLETLTLEIRELLCAAYPRKL